MITRTACDGWNGAGAGLAATRFAPIFSSLNNFAIRQCCQYFYSLSRIEDEIGSGVSVFVIVCFVCAQLWHI